MARHEVIIKQNIGATSEEAPYLPQYVKKSDLGFAALCKQVATESGLTDTQVRAIFEGAFDEFAALEQESAVRIHVDGITVGLAIYGSFASSDAEFDPLENSLELVIYLDDDIKNALVNVTPTIVTEETSSKVRITNVADVETPRPYEVIHGQHVFEVQGYNLEMSDAGAGVEMVNPSGVVFACTVVEATSKQVIRVKTATLLEAGDYKLVVKSRGGDAEGTLQSVFRRVKYLHIEDPDPSVTLVKCGDLADNVVKFENGAVYVTLANYTPQDGDKLYLEAIKDGAVFENFEVTSQKTASAENLITFANGIENTSEKSNAEWVQYGKTFYLLRNGTRYEKTISFVA